jgi:hypothetical protein
MEFPMLGLGFSIPAGAAQALPEARVRRDGPAAPREIEDAIVSQGKGRGTEDQERTIGRKQKSGVRRQKPVDGEKKLEARD